MMRNPTSGKAGHGFLAAVLLMASASSALAGNTDGERELGRSLYGEYCASCHGAELEGQPDWKRPLPSGRLPAPPHDATGHTWHHPDRILLEIISQGTAEVVGGGYESDMPGFGHVLSEEEIAAILDYIKSTWPDREREYQERATQADVEARK